MVYFGVCAVKAFPSVIARIALSINTTFRISSRSTVSVWSRTLLTGNGPLFFGLSFPDESLSDVPGCGVLTVGGMST